MSNVPRIAILTVAALASFYAIDAIARAESDAVANKDPKKTFLLVDDMTAANRKANGPASLRSIRELYLPAAGAQQGIATDGKHLYLQQTRQLLKYDFDGKLIKAGPKLKLHHGGITLVDGRIYAAASACLARGSDQHAIRVYNAETLDFLQAHDIGGHFSVCAGGIASHLGHWFVAESFYDNEHKDRVVEFDDGFKHVRDHEIDFQSPFGIQGLEYLPATDEFLVFSHGRDFYRIDARFAPHSLKPAKAEFNLQDVARIDEHTLVINHRAAQKALFVSIAP